MWQRVFARRTATGTQTGVASGSLSLGLLELSSINMLDKPAALQGNLSARAEALCPQLPPQAYFEPLPRPTVEETNVPPPSTSLPDDHKHTADAQASAETGTDLQAAVHAQQAELEKLKLQESLLAQQAEIEALQRRLAPENNTK